MWAVLPGAAQVGETPERVRAVKPEWTLLPGETFTVTDDPTGKVLDTGLLSLRDKSDSEELAEAKTARKALMAVKRDAAINAETVTYLTWDFPCDENTRAIMNNAITTLREGIDDLTYLASETISFRDAGGTFRDLTIVHFNAIARLMRPVLEGHYATKAGLDAQIDAAATVAEVQAIDWP